MSERARTRPDVVIVGGGTTGCIMAARLSEDPRRSVLLLEAGADHPGGPDALPEHLRTEEVRYPSADITWIYPGRLTAAHETAPVVLRGRVIGGSGAINGAIHQRGAREDYDGWGSPLWTYESVLPYFKRYESDQDFDGPLHGGDGPVPVRRFTAEQWPPSQKALHEAALAAGYPPRADHMDPEGSGVGATPRNSRDDIRMSAALTHLEPARSRPNLEVRGDTQVLRVLFDGTRATGVEIADGDGTQVIEAGEVILTAGAIASPHLLMVSGVGPAPALRELGIDVIADLPVGQNLRDHPMVVMPLEGFDLDAEEARHHVLLTYTATGSRDRNDMNIFVGGCHVPGEEGDLFLLLFIATLEAAHSTGEIVLTSADPRELPLVHYNYLDEESDRVRLREATRISASLLEHEAYTDLGMTRVAPTDEVLASDEALDAWIAATVQTNFHTCGTCRMGAAGDPGAVVDDHGRVHGLQGLRVADLSIAPDAPRSAANATAFMLAERMADLCRAD